MSWSQEGANANAKIGIPKMRKRQNLADVGTPFSMVWSKQLSFQVLVQLENSRLPKKRLGLSILGYLKGCRTSYSHLKYWIIQSLQLALATNKPKATKYKNTSRIFFKWKTSVLLIRANIRHFRNVTNPTICEILSNCSWKTLDLISISVYVFHPPQIKPYRVRHLQVWVFWEILAESFELHP